MSMFRAISPWWRRDGSSTPTIWSSRRTRSRPYAAVSAPTRAKASAVALQTDEALAICDLKRFVADYAFKNEKPYKSDIVFPKNGKSIAIIGAGASGLTCAHYLVRIGYTVDVYESEAVAGGVLAFGIPEYRLPKHVLAHEIDLITEEGVTIHLNTEVGKDITFKTLKLEYDAIYLSTGTQFPQKVNIPGEELPGVIHGIDFLKCVNLRREMKLGKVVAVIGGGNTAIDSARTALRLGAEKVMILYRRTIDAMACIRKRGPGGDRRGCRSHGAGRARTLC